MKILVVDDDPLAADMVATMVELAGHEPTIAEDALAAIDVLNNSNDISLILCDMNMPLVNGLEFFQELRQQQINMPFVLLTGDEPDLYLAKEPRLDACLNKDFSLSESLPNLISRILPSAD